MALASASCRLNISGKSSFLILAPVLFGIRFQSSTHHGTMKYSGGVGSGGGGSESMIDPSGMMHTECTHHTKSSRLTETSTESHPKVWIRPWNVQRVRSTRLQTVKVYTVPIADARWCE
jgi:hypothetical protein